MSQLDHLREEIAYLKFWLGIFVVTDISLAGWLISSPDTRSRLHHVLRGVRLGLAERWYSVLASTHRTSDCEHQGAIAMELIAAIAMFCVVLVIVGVGCDAGRRAK